MTRWRQTVHTWRGEISEKWRASWVFPAQKKVRRKKSISLHIMQAKIQFSQQATETFFFQHVFEAYVFTAPTLLPSSDMFSFSKDFLAYSMKSLHLPPILPTCWSAKERSGFSSKRMCWRIARHRRDAAGSWKCEQAEIRILKTLLEMIITSHHHNRTISLFRRYSRINLRPLPFYNSISQTILNLSGILLIARKCLQIWVTLANSLLYPNGI